MKIETILNAMVGAWFKCYLRGSLFNKDKSIPSLRQYHAFRDHIIRMDERNKMRIKELEVSLDFNVDIIEQMTKRV